MPNFTPASRFKRFLASMLDGLVTISLIYIPLLGLGFYFSPGKSFESVNYKIGNFCSLGSFLYFVLMEQSAWRATLGKKCFGLYVSDVECNKISLLKSIIRYSFYLLPSLPLIIPSYICPSYTLFGTAENDINRCGDIVISSFSLTIILWIIWFAPILFSSRRGLHDRLSGTWVRSVENLNSKQ